MAPSTVRPSASNLSDVHALVAEHSAAPVIVTDATGRVRWVNCGFTRMTGYTLEEAVGRTPGAMLQGPDTDPNTVAEMRAAIGRGEGFAVEVLNYTKQGKSTWLHLTVDPFHDESGALAGFIGVQSDVSERKRVERELEQARAALAEAQRLARVGSWEWRITGDVVQWSEELYDMFGLDATRPAPRFAEHPNFYEPESFARLAEAVQRSLATGLPYRESNLRLVRVDGSRLWGEATGAAVRDQGGQIIGLRGTLQDVTGWKEAQEARRLSDERAHFALEGAGDGVWDWDIANDRVLFSSRWKSMLGYSDAEIGDRFEEWSERVHPDDFPQVHQELLDHLAGQAIGYSAEVRMRTATGTWHWVRTRGMVVSRAPDGRPLRMIGTHADIAEQKALEAALRAERDRAESATAAKSAFLARISHELRTPLNSVIGFGRLLAKRQGYASASEQQRWIERVVENGRHLLRLIDDVLDLSAIEARRLGIHREVVDVAAIVRDVAQSLAPMVPSTVQLVMQGAALPVWRVTDGHRLRQVLMNVVGNAAKFTDAGQILVVLEASPDRETLAICVSDTGCGIPSERTTAIFDAFEQVDGTTQRRYGGSGLGLTISRALCEQLGGRLSVESRVGVGSTFRIEIAAPPDVVSEAA